MRKFFLFSLACVCINMHLGAQGADFYKKFSPNCPPVHDPVVAQCDGVWYMFTTGWGVNVFSSDNFIDWHFEGHVFDKAPQWAVDSVSGYKGHTWAPDIFFHNGLWYLYYSCSSFGKNTSAIGVATNKTLDPLSPDYCWEDHGMVVNSVAGRDNWNAIDPNVVLDDNGDAWLSFGSFWSGIKIVKLDSTLTRPAEPQQWYPLCRRPDGTAPDTSKSDKAIKLDDRGPDFNPGNGAVEAPFIIRKDGYYYMFVSYDLCCRGPKSTYKVVVGRSANVYGPYLDAEGRSMMQGGGTVVASGNERYPGVGHCAVVSRDGEDYMVMHGYDKKHKYNATLLIRRIKWNGAWPEVEL